MKIKQYGPQPIPFHKFAPIAAGVSNRRAHIAFHIHVRTYELGHSNTIRIYTYEPNHRVFGYLQYFAPRLLAVRK